MLSTVKVRKSFRSRLRRRAQFLAMLLGTIPMAGSAFAQTSYWSLTSATVGGWNSTANWSPNSSGGTTAGTIPVASIPAFFNATSVVPGTAGVIVTLDGNRAAQGITFGSTTPVNLQGNAGTVTTVRNLSIGAGGVTLNAGAARSGTNVTAGEINTLLTAAQTWTNNNAGTTTVIDWNGRLVGQESSTLTIAGPGRILLRGDNAGVTATVNGVTTTGLRGKIVVSPGSMLSTLAANALGIRDAQTTALTPTPALSLVSDTQILNGGTLETNNQTLGAEYVRFEGSGVGGIGAIVNLATGTGNTNNVLTQVEMTGPATIGGNTARFDFRSGTAGAGRFFQNGFALTKTGGNTIGIVNTQVLGGGDIAVRQGTLTIDSSTVAGTGTLAVSGGTFSVVNAELVGGRDVNITGGTFTVQGSTSLQDITGTTTSAGTGTITQSAGTLNFNAITGSVTRPISRSGGTIQGNANDAISIVGSPITNTSPGGTMTISVTDDGTATTQVGTLNLTGLITQAGTGALTKTNGGNLFINLDGSTYAGSAININGGGFNLAPAANPIIANINLAAASTVASVLRPGLSGEGQTTGTLSFLAAAAFGTGTSANANILTFNGNTTGATDHLRVGDVVMDPASRVQVKLAGATPAGTGLVVLDSTSGTIGTIAANPEGNGYFFNGRGSLVQSGNQLQLNYNGIGNLTWRGNDATQPQIWNQAGLSNTATTWDNGGVADAYFDGDNVTFDDSVGAGTTNVVPFGAVTPTSITFNNGVNYTVGGVSTGLIAAPNATLVKSGTGTVTLNTLTGGGAAATNSAHSVGAVTLNAGVLDVGTVYAAGAQPSINAITPVLGFGGSGITINSGATLRSNLVNVANSGFGANPVTINAGGVLDITRGAVTANATNTTASTTTLSNNLSGAGTMNLTGVSQVTPPGTAVTSAYGLYALNGVSPNFSGTINLNSARVDVDNGLGDELGTATVVVNNGSQVNLGGDTDYGGNQFRLAGSGWVNQTFTSQVNGALRLSGNGTLVDSTASVVLTDNARITAQNVTAEIAAPISEVGGSRTLDIGQNNSNQNANLTLSGANTYTGGTNIHNHNVMASNNAAFGTGTVNILGTTSARTTYIAVGNGVNIANPITITSFSGQGGSRGVIEGGRVAQTSALGIGAGIVSGPVNIVSGGNQINNWAHFSAGEAAGSALNVTGPVIANVGPGAVQARSQNVGGYVQFGSNGTSSFSRFDHALGTVRLGSNEGLAIGTEYQTRRVADVAGVASSVFDMQNFNQSVSFVSRSGTLTTANFTLTNTGTGSSTLTIAGTSDSFIQNVAAGGAGGVVNIVKNGTGGLVLGSGTAVGVLDASTVNLSNTGTYTVNGGTLAIQRTNGGGAVAVAGAIVANTGTIVDAGGNTFSNTVSLNSATLNNGGTFNGAVNLDAGTLNGTSTFAGVVTGNNGSVISGPVTLTPTAVLNNASGVLTVSGAVTAQAGSQLRGNTVFNGAVTAAGGGLKFAPGSSPGTQTFNAAVAVSGSGNSFDWEILTATGGVPGATPPPAPVGTPGTDYDQLVLNGGLDLTNLDTAGFAINVVGLSALPSTQGAVAGFDPTQSYTWLLFDNASLTGFDPADFTIDTSSFGNNNAINGTFSVAQIGTDVVLQYSAVPEPGSIMLIVGAGLGLMMRRRRSKNDGSELIG